MILGGISPWAAKFLTRFEGWEGPLGDSAGDSFFFDFLRRGGFDSSVIAKVRCHNPGPFLGTE